MIELIATSFPEYLDCLQTIFTYPPSRSLIGGPAAMLHSPPATTNLLTTLIARCYSLRRPRLGHD